MTDSGWLDAIEATHVPDHKCRHGDCGDVACAHCMESWPCTTARLVSALREAQAKVERVEALAADFDGGQYNIICRLIRAALVDPKETE